MAKRFFLSFAIALAMSAIAVAQQTGVGPNINIVGGPARVDLANPTIVTMGDPNLNRQNEPSGACSSRNPLNCLVGTNDYRAVREPGTPDGKVTGDAALGVFWTRDGGLTWRSWLLPGYHTDPRPEAANLPSKPYEAMADPTVRGGTNGLFYFTGIAFNRSAVGSNSAGTEGKDGVLFATLYIDDNNTQQVDTPFRHIRQTAIAYSNGARFLDKPTMAVDIPRQGSASCTIPASADGKIPAQTFPGGNVYVAYSAFMGPTDHEHTKIMFVRSTDCGQTWGGSVKLSESFKINQSAAITITPAGQVQVAWREFSSITNSDQLVVATSDDFGQSFKKGVVASALSAAGASTAFDQPSLPAAAAPDYRMFRTNSYPAICAASDGKTYLLWSERIDPGTDRLSRIMYASSADGLVWSTPSPVDGAIAPGHQFMPAVSCAGNRVTALWYDQRDDAAVPITLPLFGVGAFIADLLPLTIPARTLDVRSAQLTTDAAAPSFAPSVKVSRYPVGIFSDGTNLIPLQLQYNLENLPLFAGGKMPFIGDYIDVIPATTFLPVSANGGQSGVTVTGITQKNNSRATRNAQAAALNGWEFNTTAAGTPVFHAFWTDNRNVVPGAGTGPDPFAAPSCSPGTQAGSKNQDVYTARLTRGLAAGVFGNARTQRIDPATTPGFPPLTQRAYSVYVQNLTDTEKFVNLQIATDLTSPEKASFRQFGAAALDSLQAKIAPYSGIARTVYVTTNAGKSIRVDVDEIVPAGETGDATFVMINPDPTNPAPFDAAVAEFRETHGVTLGTPDIANISLNDLDISATNLNTLNPNFLNPNFLNPNFLNPNFLNPNFLNPNFLNPNFLNPNFLNPNFLNPNFLNPNFLNPNFLNPNFLNPNFLNPNFLNGAPDPTLTTMTWETEAAANTGSSYLFRALTTQPLDPAWLVQVLIYRLYFAPGAAGNGTCDVIPTVRHELVSSVKNPTTLSPAELNLDAASQNFLSSAENPEVANTSFALSAGDKALITLQILTPDGALTVEEAREMISAIVIPVAVNSTAAAAGITTPAVPLTITTGTIPRVMRDVAYDTTLTAAGGVLPYTWSLTSGTLPPGLALTSGGQLQGTATAAGSYPVVIKVTDAANPAQTASRPFTVRVVHAQLLNGDFENGLTDWTLLSNDAELQQAVVPAPSEFVPPLQGNAYKIRPGSQSPGAGLSQTVAATPGQPYSWSVSVAAKDVQNPGEAFPLGTFELLLNGTVVATVTYNDANPHSQTFSGTYTPSADQIEFKMVFNRGLNSFSAHPQWFVDDAYIGPPALISILPDALSSGDFLYRGFYLQSYPGTSLSSVTLWMKAATAGLYTASMTVRQNAYDGPVIGTSTATFALPGNLNANTPVTFSFPSPAVTPGSLVTFAMSQDNPPGSSVYYNVCVTATCSANNPIIQTNGTTAPLDTFRRNGIAIRIMGGGGQ